MALDYILELEGDPPDWSACIEAAKAVGHSHLKTKGLRFDEARFDNSNGYFWSTENWRDQLSPISAEGNHGCNFQTRYSIVFRINSSEYEKNRDDIHQFCVELSNRSTRSFVLSFQLEGVRATRDSSGLIWTWDNPR